MRYLVFVLMLLPLPAFALSCAPHGVADAYLLAEEAKESYLPVYGKLDFDVNLLPQNVHKGQRDMPQQTLIPATFKGEALSKGGLNQKIEIPVMLEVGCTVSWCGSPKPVQSIAFLRETPEGYALSENACGGFWFGQPDKAQLNELLDCHNGARCDPVVKFR